MSLNKEPSNFTSSHELARSIVKPIAAAGKQRVPNSLMAGRLADSFDGVALSATNLITAELRAIGNVNSTYYPVIKLNLLRQWKDLWSEVVSSASKNSTLFKDLMDYMDSREDMAQIEGQNFFEIINDTQGQKLLAITEEMESLRDLIHGDHAFRFIPTMPATDLVVGLEAAKSELSNQDTMPDLTRSLFLNLTQEQNETVEAMIDALQDWATESANVDESTNMLEIVTRATNTPGLRSPVASVVDYGLVSKSYPALPKTSDGTSTLVPSSTGLTNFIYSTNMRGVIPLCAKRGKKGPDDVAISDLLFSDFILLALRELVSSPTLNAYSFTLPTAFAISGGLIELAANHAMRNSVDLPELETIKCIRDICKSSNKSPLAIEHERRYERAIDTDVTNLSQTILKIQEMEYHGLLMKSLDRIVAKRGKQESAFYCRNGFGDIAVRNGVKSILDSGSISCSLTEGMFTSLDSYPASQPEKYAEAIVRRSVFRGRAIVSSVGKKAFQQYMKSGFELLDHDETTFSIDFSLDTALSLTRSICQSEVEPFVPLKKLEPVRFKVSDALKLIPTCKTNFELEDGLLLEISPFKAYRYYAGTMHIPFNMSLMKARSSDGACFQLGLLENGTPTVEMKGLAQELVDITSHMIGGSSHFMRPSFIDKLNLDLDFKNAKYSDRRYDFNDEFSEWSLHPGVAAFLSHPITFNKAEQLLDGNLIREMTQYEYLIHDSFVSQLKGIATARTRQLRRSLGNSDVMKSVINFISGKATVKDVSRIKSETLCHTIFDNILQIVLESTNSDDKLARAVILSVILESLTANLTSLEARKVTTLNTLKGDD